MAGEKNEIINGGPGLDFPFELYDKLEAMSIQNQMNEFMASQKFAITIAFESNKDPDEILSKVDNSSYSMMDDVLAAINDAGYGMRYGGKKGNSKEGDGSNSVITLGFQGAASIGVIGLSVELGVATDGTNTYSLYFTIEHAIGADLSSGLMVNVHSPVDANYNLSYDDVEGWGEYYNISAGPFDGTLGGNSLHSGIGPETWSDYHTKYKTKGFGVGSISPLIFGLTRNKGYTWFFFDFEF